MLLSITTPAYLRSLKVLLIVYINVLTSIPGVCGVLSTCFLTPWHQGCHTRRLEAFWRSYQAGGPIHYALYEPGRILQTEKLLFQIYFIAITFLIVARRRGHVEIGSLRWLSMEVWRCPFDPLELPWTVRQRLSNLYWAGTKVYQASGQLALQTTLHGICNSMSIVLLF